MVWASGERHYASKLTQDQVERMRSMHRTPCECCGQIWTVRALAHKFKVSKATAGHAISGRNWSNSLSTAKVIRHD